jgi:protein TonB
MTTAIRTLQNGPFPPSPAVPAEGRVRPRKKNESATLFVVCSFAIHAGLVVLFSSLPGPAHASARPVQEIEVAFLEEETAAVPPPPPEALPMGSLDEAEIAPPQPRAVTRKISSPSPQVKSDTPPVSAAPSVLTSNNPYENANLTSFTSGSASAASTRVVAHAPPPSGGSSFGVESGSKSFSEEKAAELKAWYGKVRAQLASAARRSYPKRARHQGLEGIPTVAVRIGQNGRLLSASIHKGSDHSILDRAALSGIRSAGKLPPPPHGTGTHPLTISVTYRLR